MQLTNCLPMNPKHLDTQYKKYLYWSRKERELISKIDNQPYINIKPYKEGEKLVPYLMEEVRDPLLEEFFDKFLKNKSRYVYKEFSFSSPKLNRYYEQFKMLEDRRLAEHFNLTNLTEADLIKFGTFISYKSRLIIHIKDSINKIRYRTVPYYVYAVQSHDGALYSELNYIRRQLDKYPQYQTYNRKYELEKKEKKYYKARTKELIKEYFTNFTNENNSINGA